jgi:hypothetical protein
MVTWTAETTPADWSDWRSQWEYGHAARAFLLIGGFASLVFGLALDMPLDRHGVTE